MDVIALKTMFVTLITVLVISIALAIYYFSRMIGEIDPKKNTLANIVPWAVPFIPNLLTNTGRSYQSRFVLFLLAGAVSAGGLFIIDSQRKSQKQPTGVSQTNNLTLASGTLRALGQVNCGVMCKKKNVHFRPKAACSKKFALVHFTTCLTLAVKH